MIMIKNFCTQWIQIFSLVLCFSPWAHAVWTPEMIRELALDQLCQVNETQRVFYRWGDAEFELARVESKLSPRSLSFDLSTVNQGNQAGGRGLYALESLSEASLYTSFGLLGSGRRPALVEVVLKPGALVIDLVDPANLDKLLAVGLTPQDVLDSDPPAMIRFSAVDVRNPGFQSRSIWVAKNPHDIVIREFKGQGLHPFTLLENESRILDVSGGNQRAFRFYQSRVENRYREGAYIYAPATGQAHYFDVREDFVSIATHRVEPVLGVRLDGSCGLFLPTASSHVISVVKDLDREECRRVFPTQLRRDITGQCAEALEQDPRVVLGYVEDRFCSLPLFCRSREVVDPVTQDVSFQYAISSSQSPFVNYPADPAAGFGSLKECLSVIDFFEHSRMDLMCLPSREGVFKVSSYQSVIPPLPEYGSASLEGCFSWIRSARKDLQLLCEKKGDLYDIISYAKPLLHRPIGVGSFASLQECQSAMHSLKSDVNQSLKDQSQERATIFKDVALRHPEDLIKYVRFEYPYLKSIFQSSAQSDGVETIEERVSQKLESAQGFYSSDSLGGTFSEDLNAHKMKALMNALFLVHEGGLAIGRTMYRKQLTSPMLQMLLDEWGFTKSEIKLALEIFMNDLIPSLVAGTIPVDAVIESFKRKAERSGVSAVDFFTLQSIYDEVTHLHDFSSDDEREEGEESSRRSLEYFRAHILMMLSKP